MVKKFYVLLIFCSIISLITCKPSTVDKKNPPKKITSTQKQPSQKNIPSTNQTSKKYNSNHLAMLFEGPLPKKVVECDLSITGGKVISNDFIYRSYVECGKGTFIKDFFILIPKKLNHSPGEKLVLDKLWLLPDGSICPKLSTQQKYGVKTQESFSCQNVQTQIAIREKYKIGMLTSKELDRVSKLLAEDLAKKPWINSMFEDVSHHNVSNWSVKFRPNIWCIEKLDPNKKFSHNLYTWHKNQLHNYPNQKGPCGDLLTTPDKKKKLEQESTQVFQTIMELKSMPNETLQCNSFDHILSNPIMSVDNPGYLYYENIDCGTHRLPWHLFLIPVIPNDCEDFYPKQVWLLNNGDTCTHFTTMGGGCDFEVEERHVFACQKAMVQIHSNFLLKKYNFSPETAKEKDDVFQHFTLPLKERIWTQAIRDTAFSVKDVYFKKINYKNDTWCIDYKKRDQKDYHWQLTFTNDGRYIAKDSAGTCSFE